MFYITALESDPGLVCPEMTRMALTATLVRPEWEHYKVAPDSGHHLNSTKCRNSLRTYLGSHHNTSRFLQYALRTLHLKTKDISSELYFVPTYMEVDRYNSYLPIYRFIVK